MHQPKNFQNWENLGFTQVHEGAPTVDDVLAICSEFPELEKLNKSSQTLATYSEPDWTPPIYNPTPFLPEFYLSLARVVITSAIVGNAHQPTVHRRKTALKAIVARAI